MTTLPPGQFWVRAVRKNIPAKVKLEVMSRDYEVDHDPALMYRPYDTEAGDFIPPQNDPKFLFLRRKDEHREKTFGRKPGAERTVTTRGSDVGEAARTRKIRRSQATHLQKLEVKHGNTEALDVAQFGRVLHKRKIPSRRGARMHLTQRIAADLIPLLQYFVDTGELPRSSHIKIGRDDG